jgi:hypothetical protein
MMPDPRHPDRPYLAARDRDETPLSPVRAAARRKHSSRRERRQAVPDRPCPPAPKPIWASRTLWLNVIGLLLLALASPEIIEIIPVEARPGIAAGIAFLNILNRMLSTVSPLTMGRPTTAVEPEAQEHKKEEDQPT